MSTVLELTPLWWPLKAVGIDATEQVLFQTKGVESREHLNILRCLEHESLIIDRLGLCFVHGAPQACTWGSCKATQKWNPRNPTIGITCWLRHYIVLYSKTTHGICRYAYLKISVSNTSIYIYPFPTPIYIYSCIVYWDQWHIHFCLCSLNVWTFHPAQYFVNLLMFEYMFKHVWTVWTSNCVDQLFMFLNLLNIIQKTTHTFKLWIDSNMF